MLMVYCNPEALINGECRQDAYFKNLLCAHLNFTIFVLDHVFSFGLKKIYS